MNCVRREDRLAVNLIVRLRSGSLTARLLSADTIGRFGPGGCFLDLGAQLE
jgi:hypothetical protein